MGRFWSLALCLIHLLQFRSASQNTIWNARVFTGGGSCSGYGDPHYFTFDKYPHTITGNCTYTLTKLCEANSSLPYFNVEVGHEYKGGNRNMSYVKEVTLYVHSYKIKLQKQKLVTVDELVQKLPLSLSPDVSVGLSGQYVQVIAAFGLLVKYDGHHRVEVTVSKIFQKKVCGICANYNGQRNDDNLNPDGGKETDSSSYGNSWQVTTGTSCLPATKVNPVCTKEIQNVINSEESCGKMIPFDGVFQHCQMTVSPMDYFLNCFNDMCELHLDSDILCSHLQAYTDACQAAGAVVLPWRNSTFCPLNCSLNSHYEQCGTACPATCVNPVSPSNCTLPCTEGCVCDPGYVLYDKTCVPSNQCGCWEDGKHYPVGSEFWTDDTCSTKCRCPSAGGSLVCNSASCASSKYCGVINGVLDCYNLSFGDCVTWGDPHYYTFDKEIHHFMGICTYTLSKICTNATSLLYFNIEAKNERCNGNPTVSYIQSVMVDVYDHKITIVKNEPSQVLVDGIWTNLPVILVNKSLTVKQSGRYVILETKFYEFYLTVSYDTDHIVDVRIPMTLFNQTCGICGNFNGIQHDDFMMPGGQLAQNSNQLGDSWKVEYDDPLCSTIVPTPSPPCPPDTEELYSNNQFCGLLTMKDGPFKACHSVINQDYFFDSCVFDLCALGAGSLCKALEAYADTCQRAEVTLTWRNSTFCSIPCSANSHYNPCTSACPATCQDQSAQSNCSKPCTDACECDNGFVLSGPTCVPISECGCFYDGKYYQKNEIFWKGDCNSQCTCQGNNHVNCTTQTCDPEEVCKVQNGIKACFPADTSICHIYGDPHYITFDGKLYHFQGACNYTAVETCRNTSVHFSITTRNEHRGGLNWTAINSVAVSFNDLNIILGKNKVVEINGLIISLPGTPAPGISIDLSGSFVVVQTGFGLEVKFSGDHELFVRVNENFKGKLCGLCGTYNGNQQDDFLTPGGVLAPTSNDFGSSWRVPDDNWVCEDDIVDPSPCDPAEKNNYEDKCKLILSSSGPFKDCHPHIIPQIYFENCVYDLCATGGNQYKFCDALEAYAAICDNTGIVVGDWRKNNTCRITTTTTIIPPVPGSTTTPSRVSTFESFTTTFITTTTVTPPYITTMDTPTSDITTSANPTSTMTTTFTPINCDTSLPSSVLTKTTLSYIPSTAITPTSSSPVTTLYTTSSTTASTITSLLSATNPTAFSTSSNPHAPSQGSTTIPSRVSDSLSSTFFETFTTTSTTTTATPAFTTTTLDTPLSTTVSTASLASTLTTTPNPTSFVNSLLSSSSTTTTLSSTTATPASSSPVIKTTLYLTSSTTVSKITTILSTTKSTAFFTASGSHIPSPGSTSTPSRVSNSLSSTFFETFTTASTTTTATPTFTTTTVDTPLFTSTSTMTTTSNPTSFVNSLFSSSSTTTTLSSTTTTPSSSSPVITTTLYLTSSTTVPKITSILSTTKSTAFSTASSSHTPSTGSTTTSSTTTSSRVSTSFSTTSFETFTTTSTTTATATPTFTTTINAPNSVTTAASNLTSTMTMASTSSVSSPPSSSFITTNLPYSSSTTSTLPFSSSVTTTILYPTSSTTASTTKPTDVSTASRPYTSSPGSTTTSSRVSTSFSSTSFEPFTTTSTTTAKATPTFTTTMDAPNSVTTAVSNPTSTMTASTSTSSVSSLPSSSFTRTNLPYLSSTTSTLPFSSSIITTILYPTSSNTASTTNPTAVSTASRPYTSSPDQTTAATTKMALSSNIPGSTTTSSRVSTSFSSTSFEPFATTSTTTATATPTFTSTMNAPNSVTTAVSNPTSTMTTASTSTSSVPCLPSSSFTTTNPPYLSSTTRTPSFSSSVTTTTIYPTSSATASTTNPTAVSTASRPYTSSPGSTTTPSRVLTSLSSTSFETFTTTSTTTITATPTFTTTMDIPTYVTTTAANPTSTMTMTSTSTSFVTSLPSSFPVTTTTLYPISTTTAFTIPSFLSTTNPEAFSTASRPHTPSPGFCLLDCSFDVSFCNWKQSVADSMDWIHWTGSTPSFFTGPSYDHTTGYGYYLYIDGRFSHEGDFARLESPTNCFSGRHCLQFWYHMYGVAQSMMLRVAVLRENGLEYVTSIEGNQGDMWHVENIFLPDSQIIQIFIEGVRGEDFRSNVAIDDISFFPGYCPGIPTTTTTTTSKPSGTPTTTTTTTSKPSGFCLLDCSFDVGFCNWKQSVADSMDWIHWTGSTPSSFTGPSYDHTTGYGYYLYTDGRFSHEGNFARLESPTNCFSGRHCLQFWYHMYGVAQSMMLRVAVLREKGLEYVTTIEGNQGNMWHVENIFLPDSQIIQIFIEGVRGEDFRSNVAIDDISFFPGYCPGIPTTTTTTTSKPSGSISSTTESTITSFLSTTSRKPFSTPSSPHTPSPVVNTVMYAAVGIVLGVLAIGFVLVFA